MGVSGLLGVLQSTDLDGEWPCRDANLIRRLLCHREEPSDGMRSRGWHWRSYAL